MNRPDWDEVWMNVADDIGARSRCVRAQVGCVIVSEDNRVLSTSYNGPPPGMDVEGDCSNWCPRAMSDGTDLDPHYDDCVAAHAEANGIARANFTEMKGATAYVSTSSCKGCAKSVATAGVARLVHRVGNGDGHRSPAKTEQFLRDCGVTVDRWSDSNVQASEVPADSDRL